jgi:hypothetical protein
LYSRSVFWKVDGRLFNNKAKALSHSLQSNCPIFFSHHASLGKQNWATPIATPFSTLLEQRARQLRDQYNYIRFFYSGGADSHTVLLTFLRLQLPIDEIVLFRLNPFDHFTGLDNSEINFVALPFLEEQMRQGKLRRTKITLLDVGKSHFHDFYRNGYWMESVNDFMFRPTSLSHLYQLFPRFGALPAPYCDLQGGDKPRLFWEHGYYYTAFWDNQRCHSVGAENLEEFFLTEDLPELHVKQCQMVKDRLKEIWPHGNDPKEYFTSPFWRNDLNRICRYPLYRDYSVGKSVCLGSGKSGIVLKEVARHDHLLHQTYLQSLSSFLEHPANEKSRNPQAVNFAGLRSELVNLGS